MPKAAVRFGYPHHQLLTGNGFSFEAGDRAAIQKEAKRVTKDATRIENLIAGLEELSIYFYPWRRAPRLPTPSQRRKGLQAVARLAESLKDHIKNDGAIGADRGQLHRLLLDMRHLGIDDFERHLVGLAAAANVLQEKLGKAVSPKGVRGPRSSADLHRLARNISGLYVQHLGKVPTAYYKDEAGEGRGAFANILLICVRAWRDRPAGREFGPTPEQLRAPIAEAVTAAKQRRQ